MPETAPRSRFAPLPDALRLGTASAPAPAGVVAAGTPAVVAVTAAADHPGNVVDVAYRLNGGALRVAHAAARAAAGSDAQSFLAQLPALAGGQCLEYRAELRRAGQLVGVAPADGGWQTISAAAPAPAPVPASLPRSPFPACDTAGTPRFGFELDFLGALTAQLRAEVMGHTPQGFRINFFIVQGEVHGPRLRGRVRPEGGDWMCIRPDGVGEVDIRVTYEMADGALLLEQSGGVFDIGPDGYADVVRGVYTGAPPFFATPTYITADARWKWINALQCFGFGRVVMQELRVECDVYAPRLTSGPLVG